MRRKHKMLFPKATVRYNTMIYIIIYLANAFNLKTNQKHLSYRLFNPCR